mgnify:FL=1|jgi:hypothetical protein|tara:strand:+ start:176 stop:361 length:186 start_codon:yes stop_codon:yes gene_type:complete
MIKIGDKVKVVDQTIYGTVLRLHIDTSEVVIRDHDSEFNYPDNELVYKKRDVQLLGEEDDD